MPYTVNGGIRIHYEVVGDGPPLILLHGYTLSLTDWNELGYVDALKLRNRLVLISARGHGESDKPHDPEAYAMENFAADIAAVMDDLGISRADYFGYSMGGLIGFALAHQAPDRIGRMVLGGASPFPYPPGMDDPFMPILAQGASALRAFYDGVLTPSLEARLLASDMTALIACRQKRFAAAGYVASLPAMRMPSLLYAGDADAPHDGMRDAAAKMPNARFISLPGLAHVPALYQHASILPRIMDFLAGKE